MRVTAEQLRLLERTLGTKVKKVPLTALQKRVAKAEREKYEDALAVQLSRLGLVPLKDYIRQSKFIPNRDYRADFLFGATMLIVEVDGGTWLAHSSHGRGGYEKDRERDGEAIARGWVVLRVTPKQVMDGRAAEWVVRAHRSRWEQMVEKA